jgi:hypothetical protein
VMDAPLPSTGNWNLARIADLSLAQAAFQVANGRIWLPAMEKSDVVMVPITTLAMIGQVGPYHSDINGDNANGTIRGPFTIATVEEGSAPTYPVLWSHDAHREATLQFEGDAKAQHKRPASKEDQESVDLKAASIWNTASHCHFNQNFQFNSQPTAMQFTPRRTIGGRAWPSISLASVDLEKALVLWGNTSLGLLLHWWHSNKQQAGRGNVTPTALETLPILNVAAIYPEQLRKAVELFDELCEKQMLPVHEIDNDPARRELDERFASDVLGLPEWIVLPGGPLELLRVKFALEPSIRGNK